MSAAVACRSGRTAAGRTPDPISVAAAALACAVAGEVPENSHQEICVGEPGEKDCARSPSHRPSPLTSWGAMPPGATRSSASPVLEYDATAYPLAASRRVAPTESTSGNAAGYSTRPSPVLPLAATTTTPAARASAVAEPSAAPGT